VEATIWGGQQVVYTEMERFNGGECGLSINIGWKRKREEQDRTRKDEEDFVSHHIRQV